MLYLDTSIVLALFIGEAASPRIESWLAAKRQPLAFSDWGLTECASALGIKRRRGELDSAGCDEIFETIAEFVHGSCEILICGNQHQGEAQRMLRHPSLALRAGDALHLALSQQAQATLVTYDKALLASAKTIGAKVHNPLAKTAK